MPDLLRTLDTLVQALDDKRTFEHPEKVRAGKSVSDSSAPSNLELEAEKLEEESRELQRQVYDSLKERFGDRITPDEFR